jgi:hypothetical protein
MGSLITQYLSRRSVLVGAVSLAVGCASAPQARVDVLFVCRYATVKSAIAREHFRRLAVARGMDVRTQSRGITPEDHVTPALAAALASDGVDLRADPIGTLTAADLDAADIIIVFDALPVEMGPWPVRDWSDMPSMNADYSAARAVLVPRLNALLDEIAAR